MAVRGRAEEVESNPVGANGDAIPEQLVGSPENQVKRSVTARKCPDRWTLKQ